MRVVLDEAEAARRLVKPVQAHDQPLDLAALGEELVDLLLGREERQVADVEGRGVGEGVLGRLLGLGAGGAVVSVAVVVAAALELGMQVSLWGVSSFGLFLPARH